MKKNIAWFMEQMKLMTRMKDLDSEQETWYISEGALLEALNELDEPEILSQEWIDENKVARINNLRKMTTDDVVPVDKLQNLLVPKQELPVIPNHVAKWISGHHERFDLYPALKRLENNALSWEGVYDWYRKNTRKFVNAYLTGKYEVEEVEEEPLYRARLKVITDEFIASYLRTQSSDADDRLKALEIGSKYIHEDYRHLSEFTEDELKRLDILDSGQWEVEGLEE